MQITNNLEQLNNLSEAERNEVLKILEQMSEGGISSAYEKLKYADYKEVPVDIETFITSNQYLGKAWKLADGTLKIYPYWIDKLKELFPDNLSTNMNNAIFSGARGLGKSEIAVTCLLYLMHRVMCLKHPHDFFNLKPTEKICFAFMNITKTLAEEIGISKFQATVQMSPWFMERGTMSGRDTLMWNPPDFINIIVGSQSSHVIGQPIFACLLDEISFVRNQDIDRQKQIAMDIMDTAIGGMKTRFIHKGKNPTLMILASSKRTEKSFLEEHMKKKLADEGETKNTLIVDEPVWNIKPADTYSGKRFNVALGNKFLQSEIIPENADLNAYRNRGFKILDVPVEFRSEFLDDIDRALCDYAGISSSELSKYINGPRLSETKSSEYQNPFINDVLEIGNAPDDTNQYYDFFDLERVVQKYRSYPLFIHLDMSISGDKTGIAGVWITEKRPGINNDARELCFRLAFSVSIKAPKGYQVSFAKNREFVYWLKEQGFRICGITTDTYQNASTGQDFIAKGFNYETLSVDRVNNDRICLLGDSIINCPTGDKKIVDILPGDTVYSYNINTNESEVDTVVSWAHTDDVTEYYSIETEDGEIKCTPNHLILTQRGYVRADSLLESDFVVKI